MQHKHEPMRIRDKSPAKKQGTLKILMSFFEIRFCRRYFVVFISTLHWHHNGNGRDGVSNHQLLDCALNHLFRRISNRTPKLRATGLCEGNSPVTGEFPAPKASNAEKIFPFDDVIMNLVHGKFVHCPSATIMRLPQSKRNNPEE